MNSSEVIVSDALRAKIGQYAVDRIKTRTRLGKGVKEFNTPSEKLKPLSRAYIKQRVKDSKLSSQTTPSKSNLTRSGGMLDSLTYKVSGDKVIIGFDKSSAERKAGYVSDERPFLTLSTAEYNGLIRLIRKEVLKKLQG